jgi:ABC-type transport system involved in Fe-S cluster assembly fused permease/ATPase subunit
VRLHNRAGRRKTPSSPLALRPVPRPRLTRAQVQKALIDMENMFELLYTQPSVEDSPGARALVVAAGRVDFDAVVFGYGPTQPPVLRGVSFTVPGASRQGAPVRPCGT